MNLLIFVLLYRKTFTYNIYNNMVLFTHFMKIDSAKISSGEKKNISLGNNGDKQTAYRLTDNNLGETI